MESFHEQHAVELSNGQIQDYLIYCIQEKELAWSSCNVLWYNDIHRHSAIRFVTPNQRHRREDIQILQHRQAVYEKAKSRNRNRWSGTTRNWDYIDHVWLNPPKGRSDEATQIAA